MSDLRVSLAPKGYNVSQITIFGCTSLTMADVNSVMSKDARFSLSVRSHSIAICAENLSQNTIKNLSEYYLSEFFMLAFLYNKDNQGLQPFEVFIALVKPSRNKKGQKYF